MRVFRMHQWLIVAACACYVLVGYGVEFAGRSEVFPIASWNLFSRVAEPVRTDYGLVLITIDCNRLEPPVFLEDAEGIVDNPRSNDVYNLIQRWGTRVEAGRADAVVVQEQVEALLFKDLAVRYELVRRSADLRELYREGRYRQQRTIAEGEKDA